MTPDEPNRTAAPTPCQTCAHANTYLTMGEKKVLCSLGKPAAPVCRWHLDRLQGAQK